MQAATTSPEQPKNMEAAAIAPSYGTDLKLDSIADCLPSSQMLWLPPKLAFDQANREDESICKA